MEVIAASLLGLVMGSFISALVWRLREQEAPRAVGTGDLSIVHGRSLCPRCRHRLAAADLIPLLSWVSLGGKCRYCRQPISMTYPLLELTTAMLFGLVAHSIGFATVTAVLESVFWLGSTVGLVALAVYDRRWKLLPNRVILPLIIWAAGVRVAQTLILGDSAVLIGALIGGLGLFGSFAAIFYGSRGTWLGGGDVKLAAFIGISLGWQLGFLALMLAAWIGTAVVLAGALKNGLRLDRRRQVPFGPLLIIGTYLALFYGQQLIDWYQSTLVS